MGRLQKKCFIASCGMHIVLFLVVLFGTAFFTPEKPKPVETLRMVPSPILDNVLAGGGGNPNIARTEEKIKGDTLDPVPPKPQPVKPEPPKPKVEPKPEVAKAEPKTAQPTTKPKAPPIELTRVNKTADRAKP